MGPLEPLLRFSFENGGSPMEESRGESREVNEHTRPTMRIRTRTSLPARENEREGTSGIYFAALLLRFFAALLLCCSVKTRAGTNGGGVRHNGGKRTRQQAHRKRNGEDLFVVGEMIKLFVLKQVWV